MTDSPIWDRIAGNWKQVKGSMRARWGELTDDEMEQAKGNREKLVGILQERYGIAREEANRQIDEWAEDLKV